MIDGGFLKFKNIAIPFLVAIPTCFMLRLVQMLYTIDSATGFFKDEYKTMGVVLGAGLFVITALLAVLCFSAYERPEKVPEANVFLGIAGIVFGLTVGYQIINESFVISIVQTWQIVALIISGLLAALYLIVYGLSIICGFNIAKSCAIVLPVYFLFRIVCIFSTITYLSLTFETVITLASHCVTILFMLFFAKMVNGINKNTNFKHLLAAGISGTVLCVADSLPRIVLELLGKLKYLHSNPSSAYTVLATGLFMTALLFSYFSKNNLKGEKTTVK